MQPDKLIPRYQFKNPELLDSHLSGGHIITYSQHYNNWEWAPLCLGLQMQHHLVGIIKSISNKHIHRYMIDGRSGSNVSVVPTTETGKFFQGLQKAQKAISIVFIADQKPYGRQKRLEVSFMGKTVAFHHGAGLYSTKAGFPVFTLDVHRIGRGRYEVEATPIKSTDEAISSEELTQRYVSHLEELIKKDPSAWLWSHKRFKEILTY